MKILEKKQDCCGCHACYNACPVGAIEMKPDEEGFLYPMVNDDKCLNCNKCKKACPILHKPKLQPLSEAYGCKAKDDGERMTSTSGGAFAVLARETLAENGVVCGASFDNDNSVFHLIANNEDDLMRIKGTKYVQSRIDNTYKRLKKYLDDDKQVLFSGTPCQVAGFKSFLNKDYDNLLCVDLICHGVPSPEVWQKYLKELSIDSDVARASFRNKEKGRNYVTVNIEFKDGSLKQMKSNECMYYVGFIQNLYTRPSCFDCQFKGLKRCSDITLGDFFGVREYFPDFSDSYGVSAVIIHSENGKQSYDKISDKLNTVKPTTKQVELWNECLIDSVLPNKNRARFFEMQNEFSVEEAIEKMKQAPKNIQQKVGVIGKMKGRIKRWLV